jgi:hypothetical protein
MDCFAALAMTATDLLLALAEALRYLPPP